MLLNRRCRQSEEQKEVQEIAGISAQASLTLQLYQEQLFIFRSSSVLRLALVNMQLRPTNASEMYRFTEIKCLVFDTVPVNSLYF